jgi:hypothetical protein
MRISTLVLGLALATVGCRTSLQRVSHPVQADVPPRIDSLTDLGALPPAARGKLSVEHRDGVFTPGEWVAVTGTGLSRSDARVSIGGAAVPVEGHVEGGLLVRVPRGLSPRVRPTLTVETALGRAQRSLAYASHVVVSDVSGNHLRFFRMSPDAERLFDEAHALELTRVRSHVFSPDGGIVHAVQAHAEHYALATVHVAAAEQPALLSTLPLELAGVPLSLVDVPARAQVWLLTQSELVVFDVRDALKPREESRVRTPAGLPASIAVLGNGSHAAVLEREANLVWCFDMRGKLPVLVQTLALPPEGTPRASIALWSDAREPQRLWVLQGRSLERLTKRVDGVKGLLSGSLDRAREAVGLGEPGPTADPAPAPPPPPPARILALAMNDQLAVERELPLPDAFLPLFLRSSNDGRLLVSGITSDAARLESFGESVLDLKNATSWLSGSSQFGRVVAVDPSGARPPETLVQGMAMFFDVAQLPDGQLVYSAMRLGVHITGPGVDWRIEAPNVDAVKVRTLSWTFILPPYVSPPLSLQ